MEQAAIATPELPGADQADQLLRALVTRDIVGWATGILIAQWGGDADDAFDVLRFVARRSGRTLRDVASDLVVETQAALDQSQ